MDQYIHNIISTEHDRAILGSRDQYAEYFRITKRALSMVLEKNDKLLEDDAFTPLELNYLQQYAHLLLNTLAAMRLRYLHDDDRDLKIDTTLSGWPNYSEQRFLVHDLELKREKLKDLPSEDQIRDYMLDQLLDRQEPVPRDLMHQASLVRYYSKIESRTLFKNFTQGKVIQQDGSYLVSWSFYDINYNRPFIMFLEFDYSGKDITPGSDDLDELYKTIKSHGYRFMPLHLMATQIDREHKTVHPQKLKCVDLGPLVTIFSRDSDKMSETLQEAINQRDLAPTAFACKVRIDVLHASGHKKVSKGIFGTSRKLQQYAVKDDQFGSTFHHEYLFAPHRVLQVFSTELPELMRSLTCTIEE